MFLGKEWHRAFVREVFLRVADVLGIFAGSQLSLISRAIVGLTVMQDVLNDPSHIRILYYIG